MDRTPRLIQLFALLQSGEPRSADDLMARLGVSRRTFFRDLHALQEAGVPVYHDPDTGYRLPSNYFAQPPKLQVRELVGLMLSVKLAGDGQHPLGAAARDAMHRVLSTIPAPVRQACQNLLERVDVSTDRRQRGPDSELFAVLLRCADEGRPCEVVIETPGRPQRRIVLRPSRFKVGPQGWRVTGVPDGRSGAITVDLSKVVSATACRAGRA